MRGRALSRGLFIALVDFTCTRCPNIPSDTPLQLPSFSSGMWLTVNLCWEGRCEVDTPDGGLGVVAAGDLCVSYSRKRPAEFRYPSGRYRGVELFVNDRVAEEPAFSLLGTGDNAIRRIARKAGPAAVLAGDAELNGRMERLAALLDANDDAMAEYEVLGLLLGLQRRDLSTTKPRFLLTRAQMGMAARSPRRDGARPQRASRRPDDGRRLRRERNVTQRSDFTRAYGSTIGDVPPTTPNGRGGNAARTRREGDGSSNVCGLRKPEQVRRRVHESLWGAAEGVEARQWDGASQRVTASTLGLATLLRPA